MSIDLDRTRVFFVSLQCLKPLYCCIAVLQSNGSHNSTTSTGRSKHCTSLVYNVLIAAQVNGSAFKLRLEALAKFIET